MCNFSLNDGRAVEYLFINDGRAAECLDAQLFAYFHSALLSEYPPK